jgi:hypothetical protein
MSSFTDFLVHALVYLFKESKPFPVFISCLFLLLQHPFRTFNPHLISPFSISQPFYFSVLLLSFTTSSLSLLQVKSVSIVTRSICVFPEIRFLCERSHTYIYIYTHTYAVTCSLSLSLSLSLSHTHTSQFIRNYRMVWADSV